MMRNRLIREARREPRNSKTIERSYTLERQQLYLIQCVGEACHELGLHKLWLSVLELALLLDCEGSRLQAELLQPVASRLDVLQV